MNAAAAPSQSLVTLELSKSFRRRVMNAQTDELLGLLLDEYFQRRPMAVAREMLELISKVDHIERPAFLKLRFGDRQEIISAALTRLCEPAFSFSPLIGPQFNEWLSSPDEAYTLAKRALNTARIRYARDKKARAKLAMSGGGRTEDILDRPIPSKREREHREKSPIDLELGRLEFPPAHGKLCPPCWKCSWWDHLPPAHYASAKHTDPKVEAAMRAVDERKIAIAGRRSRAAAPHREAA